MQMDSPTARRADLFGDQMGRDVRIEQGVVEELRAGGRPSRCPRASAAARPPLMRALDDQLAMNSAKRRRRGRPAVEIGISWLHPGVGDQAGARSNRRVCCTTW